MSCTIYFVTAALEASLEVVVVVEEEEEGEEVVVVETEEGEGMHC